MATYLDTEGFKALSTLPKGFVDEVEKVSPTWVATQLDYWSRWIDSRLRKRYAIPFPAFDDTAPTPISVQGWLARIVTVRVWLKRGVDPNDLQFEMINQDAIDAKEEIQEAADSEVGLFDLPLIGGEDASAVARGSTRSYSEQSPYAWENVQQEVGRNEDQSGGGTFG